MKHKSEVLLLLRILIRQFQLKKNLIYAIVAVVFTSGAVAFEMPMGENLQEISIAQIIMLMHSPLPTRNLLFLLCWAVPQIILAYSVGIFETNGLNDEYVMVRVRCRQSMVKANGLVLMIVCLVYSIVVLIGNLAAILLLYRPHAVWSHPIELLYILTALFFSSLRICCFQITAMRICKRSGIIFTAVMIVLFLNGFLQWTNPFLNPGATGILRYYNLYTSGLQQLSLPCAMAINLSWILFYAMVYAKLYEKEDILDNNREDG